MEFDWQWLLVVPAVSFALGWIASRLDLRQWKRADREAPKAYFKGLNLLLNEQTDKAIDAFIEAVQHDPDTSELHFALGNLFRRRGEFERAVRVHQHLLQRGDLSTLDRQRAQHALALDFMKAGLIDRADEAFRALEGTPFDTEARLALLGLHERSRDWRAAADIAVQLERSGTGSFASRIAHYQCEIALEAEARGDAQAAEVALAAAGSAAPQAARPLIQRAQRLARLGQPAAAFEVGNTLRQRNPEALVRVAGEYAAWAQAAGQADVAREALTQLYGQMPGIELLRALAALEGTTPGASPRLPELLHQQPTLSAALDLLDTPAEQWPDGARSGLRDAVARAARPLQRYRCAACGFEAQRYFWQCPGCLGWDTFPPQQIESL
ncbi:lipopolysaccharide assembly protein LapB [Ideonella sp. A 288]|uniref:lipopolysaccharide assembly protein LapB n=1 Tax=Ideonella sp. A 288 TaxID=1962181 RepID=UPI000B4B4E54|nr:lipopolysaccharide assembly protein LapB [Ideonella sp. A 288]